MRGADHHDWLLEKYSIAIRSKNWCWFTQIIDMALVNASIQYGNIHGCNSMTIKGFWKAVSVKCLKLGLERKVSVSRLYSFPSTSKIDVSGDVHYDHSIGRQNIQRRCQFEGCQKMHKFYMLSIHQRNNLMVIVFEYKKRI